MQVYYCCHVTNLSRTVVAHIVRVCVEEAIDAPCQLWTDRLVSDCPIPPGGSVRLVADFLIHPPVRGENQEYIATTELVDELGRTHRRKRVRFKYEFSNGPKAKVDAAARLRP